MMRVHLCLVGLSDLELGTFVTAHSQSGRMTRTDHNIVIYTRMRVRRTTVGSIEIALSPPLLYRVGPGMHDIG